MSSNCSGLLFVLQGELSLKEKKNVFRLTFQKFGDRVHGAGIVV